MSGDSSIIHKSKRLRFGRACGNCRTKKNKCDGVRPTCSGCRSRGLPCEYLNDGETTYTDLDDSIGIDDRCSRWPTAYQIHPGTAVGANFLGRSEESNRPDGVQGGNARSLPSGETVSSYIPEESLAQDGHKKGATTSNSYFGDSSSFEFVSSIRAGSQCQESGLLSFSASSSGGQALTAALPNAPPDDGICQYSFPPREHANKLVDAYFERVHVLYPFLHERSFRARYEEFWVADGDQSSTDSSWLALLNLVFASGSEFSCIDRQDDMSKSVTPYIQCAKKIILSHGLGNPNLQLVQALLILCHYLQGTLELEECWNFVGLMIRNAESIGLHINPADIGYTRPVSRELRKRVWWGCVVLDRTLSMKLGRPCSISLADAHAIDLPCEVDDQYIEENSTTPRQPSGRFSRLSFFNQTIKLSYVIDGVLSTLYSHTPKKQGDHNLVQNRTEEGTVIGNVALLDGQLQAWWNDVPLHLKQEPELPDDVDFQRQRSVLRIRFLSIRLLLQRPAFLLLVNNKCRDDFTKAVAIASSNVCVSTAEETVRLIDSRYHRQMLNSLQYNLHYSFTSMGVLATVQTMEPSTRSLLSPVDPAALDSGMQFLRLASRHSVLAARYVALLERLEDRCTGGNDVLLSSCPQNEGSAQGRSDGHAYINQNGTHAAMDHAPLHSDYQAFTGLESLDPLFGFGMTQNFLTPEWV